MGVIENAKEIADLVKKMGDIELYRKIVALEGEVLDLTREKRDLEQKVEELGRALVFTKTSKFREPFYFADGDNTPHCAPCWEQKHQPVHLVKRWSEHGQTRYDCPICKNTCVVNSANPIGAIEVGDTRCSSEVAWCGKDFRANVFGEFISGEPKASRG